MFNFDTIVRHGAAGLGALLLTTLAVGAAVGPATAAPVQQDAKAEAFADCAPSARAHG